MSSINSIMQSLIYYFCKANDCSIYVIESINDLCYTVQIRKNGVWSSAKRIPAYIFDLNKLTDALNELYEELIKGDQNDTNGKTD